MIYTHAVAQTRRTPQNFTTLSVLPTIVFLHLYTAWQSNQSSIVEEEGERSIADRSYWNKKIHRLCAKFRNVDEALRLLDRLNLRGYLPDSLNISSIIHALCNSSRFSEAHHRLTLFAASRCIPDERTCNILIASLLNSRTPHTTLFVIRHLIQANPKFVPSLINYNRLIHQICLISKPSEAHSLLFDMISRGHLPNIVTYTTLISGYCKILELGNAQKVFDDMHDMGVLPNSLTLSILIRGVMRARDVDHGRQLMNHLWERMASERDASVRNAALANVIDSLCQEGLFSLIFQVAEEMPHSVEVEFGYAQIIDSLCRASMHHGASRIVYIMRKKGLSPSLVSYNFIIHGLCKQGGCMRAYQLFQEGIEFHYVPSEHTYKILVESLCLESDIPKAKEVLEFMLAQKGANATRHFNIFMRALCVNDNPTELLNTLVYMLQRHCHPDVITLNTIINGFCKARRLEEAQKVLHDMMMDKFCQPDIITFTTIISGLLDIGKLDEAFHFLYRVIPERGLNPGTATFNVVLRGLFKLNRASDAMRVFQSCKVDTDCVMYTIILDGLCECGDVEQAKRFWDNVIWPSRIHDDFVYASILKGLCRAEKFDEAWSFLNGLVDCGVKPNVVSYNILVDHASKLGLKSKAYQIIGEMRMNGLEPDAVTWRILDRLHWKSGL